MESMHAVVGYLILPKEFDGLGSLCGTCLMSEMKEEVGVMSAEGKKAVQ